MSQKEFSDALQDSESSNESLSPVLPAFDEKASPPATKVAAAAPLPENSCFICQRSVANAQDLEQGIFSQKICDCATLVNFHQECIKNHLTAGNDICKTCNTKYSLALQTQMKFSCARLVAIARWILFGFSALVTLASWLFVVAPSDWINLFGGKLRTYHSPDKAVLLFPGTDLVILDVFYIVFTICLFLTFFLIPAIDGNLKIWTIPEFSKHHSCFYSLFFLWYWLIGWSLAMHALGWMHDLVYIGLGVIPKENLYFHLNYQTFFVAPAAVYLLLLIFLIFKILYHVGKFVVWLAKHFCCIQLETSVVSVDAEKK